MKTLKISNRLLTIGLALLLSASFSLYTYAQRSATAATVWFPADENGNIDADNPMQTPPNDCFGGSAYCAVAFDENDLTSKGEAPINHVDEDPDLIQSTLRKAPSN